MIDMPRGARTLLSSLTLGQRMMLAAHLAVEEHLRQERLAASTNRNIVIDGVDHEPFSFSSDIATTHDLDFAPTFADAEAA